MTSISLLQPRFQKLKTLRAMAIGLAIGFAVPAFADNLPEVQRLIKQGQYPQALDKVDAYLSSRPKDAQGRFLKGLIFTEMNKPAEAISVFTKLSEDYPELPEPYNNLAVLYAQQKQYDKARTALEMAIRTHPSYSIAHENLGDVYAKLASQAYDKALQLDSSNAATQTKLSMIKELISTSSKPGTKPAAAATPAVAEPAKPAIVEAPKPAPVAVAPVAPVVKPVEKAPEPVATAKTPEVKTPAEKSTDTSVIEAEVTKAVRGWASAWSRKDVKAYLGYYANDFQTPKGMARKAWETERTQRIDKPGKLQVSVDDIKISLANDKATVRFRQNYTSATLKSSTGKTLVLVKSVGKWLIQQERVG